MKIGFLGFGKSNRALLEYMLKKRNNSFFVSEAKELDNETKEYLRRRGVEFEDGGHTEKLLECDIVYISPGVKPVVDIVRDLHSRGVKISTELQFFLSSVDQKKVIGITGTNGKSTSVALTHHALSKRGLKVFLGGNFGIPAVEALEEDYDYYVLEMSSFQLFWSENPRVSKFLLLNVSEDHLDWHSSFKEYLSSKLKPAFFQESEDLFVYNKQIESLEDLSRVKSKKIPFWTQENFITEKEIVIQGEIHSVPENYPHQMRENILATAVLYKEMFDEIDSFLESLKDFRPLPHRMEYLGKLKGRHFYNDSKATSTHAVLGALSNFNEVVLIMCGIGKKENYSLFMEKVKNKLKYLITFGDISKDLEPFLENVPHSVVKDLEEAFEMALNVSKEGDVILFSPGGASFDMYENYAKRGEHFREIFKKWKEREDGF
ncbi:UDP-N-acetylmuramoyl-L-alanine--D-glutamate ligase [Thermotoga sp. KOL6]|uniref:UDP-N-acetylmuramoyl-L-alanine--D-glutamate ligase n=1 Tax=Thermotoga sp. KOL6 TaxID=126741 RepID=UPI000C790BDF|nr:UDP-N-acetylmuramoyl-L-alanine--D-glutamate ligase [Thermotoga sp. KOL6]PLV58989.1 UDP-N-acetylmuramoylalanine--D-glutamate ligase [Thermotoga sp. KOL6]